MGAWGTLRLGSGISTTVNILGGQQVQLLHHQVNPPPCTVTQRAMSPFRKVDTQPVCVLASVAWQQPLPRQALQGADELMHGPCPWQMAVLCLGWEPLCAFPSTWQLLESAEW